MSDLLKSKILTYQSVKTTYDNVNEQLKQKEDAFKKEFYELYEKRNDLKLRLSESDEQLRLEAIQIFKETKEKKLLGGIGIREKKVLFYNEKEAFDWALDHKLALSLDKKKFEKIAEDLDFVTVSIIPTATIPKTFILKD